MLARLSYITIALCLVVATSVQAAVVDLKKSTDVTVIDHDQPGWFFGTLDGDPHTFMLYLDEPLEASFEVLVPRQGGGARDHGAIIVKQATRGVTEIARLEAKQASWESRFDLPTGSRFLRGGSYEGKLESGIYIVEVHTPDNRGPYALRFNDGSSLEGPGYIGKLKLLYAVQSEYGWSHVGMLRSPYIYVPLLLLLVAVWVYRKKYA